MKDTGKGYIASTMIDLIGTTITCSIGVSTESHARFCSKYDADTPQLRLFQLMDFEQICAGTQLDRSRSRLVAWL